MAAGLPPNAVIERFADGTVARVMIPVDLNETDSQGNPVFSLMDEKLLFKRWGIDEDSRAQAQWVEYWLEMPDASRLDSKPVHRSVHIEHKLGLEVGSLTGKISA